MGSRCGCSGLRLSATCSNGPPCGGSCLVLQAACGSLRCVGCGLGCLSAAPPCSVAPLAAAPTWSLTRLSCCIVASMSQPPAGVRSLQRPAALSRIALSPPVVALCGACSIVCLSAALFVTPALPCGWSTTLGAFVRSCSVRRWWLVSALRTSMVCLSAALRPVHSVVNVLSACRALCRPGGRALSALRLRRAFPCLGALSALRLRPVGAHRSLPLATTTTTPSYQAKRTSI